MRRAPLLLLLTLAAASLAPTCGLPGVIASVSPSPGEVVSTFEFDVVVELGSEADPASLEATLNGVPIALTGGPTVFTAHVAPGPPLLDKNKLRISAERTDGVRFRRQVPFFYLPPKARAHRITRESELIEGPLAHGRLGDWLLENSEARFIVQDGPVRDLHSVAQYGGNLIDAELVVDGVRQGNDNFLEIQPSPNIETVVNADHVEIVNDGQDGTAAIVRACGPDDLLDYVNASSQVAELGVSGVVVPPGVDDEDREIEVCTEYRLEPLVRRIEMETSLTNLDTAPVDCTADPAGSGCFFVGDYLNGAGELEQWTASTDLLKNGGIGELLANLGFSVFSYFGFGEGTGVDYGLVPFTIPGAFAPTSSSFTVAGVSFVMASNSIPLVLLGLSGPTLEVPPGETRSFRRWFTVGDGSPGNAVGVELAARAAASGEVRGVVTVDGVPVPGARVVVGTPAAGPITDLVSIFVTDEAGRYAGAIPAGTFGVAASKEGVPFEGGDATPMVRPITVTAGASVAHDIDLPATGRVRVEVVDEAGDPIPARVTVVGFDRSPEQRLGFSLFGLIEGTTGVFRDVTKDPLPYGVAWIAYAGADGVAEFDLDPAVGAYRLVVSRGTEYSAFETALDVPAGPYGTVTQQVQAQIARVLDTPGFVSSDYHVHMINSPDSRIALRNRALSMAGEGVDNVIATDHDAITDLLPTIAALGLTPHLHATIGEEITTFDYGHFNAYPQAQDPGRAQTMGSTDWGRPEPIGRDFPAYGAYGRSPAEIQAEAVGKRAADGSIQNAGLDTAVQVNHISSHFGPLRINTADEPPTSLSGPDALVFRLDPDVPNFFNPNFDGLELWNGADTGAQRAFLEDRGGIWMNLLNQGIAMTAIADTDTHTFLDLETAGARTWTPTSTGSDAPADLLVNDIGRAVKEGRAVGGQGPYLRTRLVDHESGAVATHAWPDPTLVQALDGTVDLEIDIQAPDWAPYDTVEIYVNAATTVAGRNAGVPVFFGMCPTRTLRIGAVDDADHFVVAHEAVNGAQRLRTQKTIPLELTEDAWVVVLAKGTEGPDGSPPMFPVFPRGLARGENPDLGALLDLLPTESGTRALAYANALFVDVDGNGNFDAPGCAGRCGLDLCPAP